ncbi:hypothetical protein T310_8948, partial [Rasamsonia emersonii CBS 393.64]
QGLQSIATILPHRFRSKIFFSAPSLACDHSGLPATVISLLHLLPLTGSTTRSRQFYIASKNTFSSAGSSHITTPFFADDTVYDHALQFYAIIWKQLFLVCPTVTSQPDFLPVKGLRPIAAIPPQGFRSDFSSVRSSHITTPSFFFRDTVYDH